MIFLTLRLIYTCVKTLKTELFYLNDKLFEELEEKRDQSYLYTTEEIKELESIKELCFKCCEFTNMILMVLPFIEDYYKNKIEKEK